MNDLLSLLSAFGDTDMDFDGIWDTLDDCIGYYDPCGICNGSGLDEDNDGQCDDIDDCVGLHDECGVCNGDGPNVPVIEEILLQTDSIYIEQLETWYVFEFVVDTLFTFVCPVVGCTNPEASNYNPQAVSEDGSCVFGASVCGGFQTKEFNDYTYDLVAIGNQCWFAENLRTEKYSNGDSIPGNLNDLEWTSTITGAQAIAYGNSNNLDNYGRLYNWFAVNDSHNICPTGWHVPSDVEWTQLTDFLGGAFIAGPAIESASTDTPPGLGNNTSGFSGLPGGLRGGNNGDFGLTGDICYWFSSTMEGPGTAWGRSLWEGAEEINRVYINRRSGLSIRCIKD